MGNRFHPGRNSEQLASIAQASGHLFTHHDYIMTTTSCGWKTLSKAPHDRLIAARSPVGDGTTIQSLPGNPESARFCPCPREGVRNQRQVICSSPLPSALFPSPSIFSFPRLTDLVHDENPLEKPLCLCSCSWGVPE